MSTQFELVELFAGCGNVGREWRHQKICFLYCFLVDMFGYGLQIAGLLENPLDNTTGSMISGAWIFVVLEDLRN